MFVSGFSVGKMYMFFDFLVACEQVNMPIRLYTVGNGYQQVCVCGVCVHIYVCMLCCE